MLKLYTDAAVKGNPGLAGIGIVLSGDGLYEQFAVPLHGNWNNHTAEWEALRFGLQWLIEHKKTDSMLSIYTDSQIVAASVQKNYVKNADFQTYLKSVSEMIEQFSFAEVSWIPKKENKGADNLAKQALRKAVKQKS